MFYDSLGQDSVGQNVAENLLRTLERIEYLTEHKKARREIVGCAELAEKLVSECICMFVCCRDNAVKSRPSVRQTCCH